MPPESRMRSNVMTGYSKTLIVLVFVMLMCGAFYLGILYQQQSSMTHPVEPVLISGNELPVLDGVKVQDSSPNSDNVSTAYVSSPYRVLAVLNNPHAHYTLTIATERAEEGCGSDAQSSRCNNDTMCGSIYTSPTCYFFVEPQYYADVDTSTRLAATWGEGESIDIDSIRFLNADTIEFRSSFGDGGISVQSVWKLNLKTGKSQRISRKESNAQ